MNYYHSDFEYISFIGQMCYLILLLLLLVSYSQTKSFQSQPPIWITSPFFRAGYQKVISSLTGNSSLPQYTFTYSSAVNGTPNLAYGIKNYRGNDYFGQEFYQIRKIGLTASTFSVEIQIYGITNLWLLSVAYLAADPQFPHHLNTFDNVPLNYSSGDLVNITNYSSSTNFFIETIDYSQQAATRTFKSFSNPLEGNKIVLFITSLWIRGNYGIPVKIHIHPSIINQTHYYWNATTQFQITVTRLQFSQIIFNQDDVQSSNKYFIVYQEWVTDLNGGFLAVPQEFRDNFIMAITDFQAVEARCGFQYQWEFQTDNTTNQFGVRILYSWTLTNTCGFSWARSSIFYMKTWQCPTNYSYFNLTSNLCQTLCDDFYIQNSTTYSCELEPCSSGCTDCQLNITYFCVTCDATLYQIAVAGRCECMNGFILQNQTCSQICGDGLLFYLPCDDGNLLDDDGCSSKCAVEPFYNCTQINNVSSCTLNVVPTCDLILYTKDPYNNKATIKLKVSPILQSMINHPSDYLQLNFPYENANFTVDPLTGEITIDFTYNSSLNSGDPLQISLLFGTPVSMILPQTTDNDLTLKYYDSKLYDISKKLSKVASLTGYLVISIFIIGGALASRLIAIQMIFIFQFTYCGLIMLKKLQTLMDPLKQLWIVNGFNQLVSDPIHISLPPKIQSIYYKGQFLSNFNLNIAVCLLPFLISLITYLIGFKIDSTTIKDYAKRISKQWGLSLLIFVLFQVIFALVLSFRYSSQTSIGAVISILILLTLVFLCYAFWKWPDHFGDYKDFFGQQNISSHFYIIIVSLRLLIALSMVVFSESIAAAILSFIFLLGWALLVIIIKPYENNFRPIVNSCLIIPISILFLYTRSQLDSPDINFATYLPLIIVAILLIALTFNLIFFILHFIIKLKKGQNAIANLSEAKQKNSQQGLMQKQNIKNEPIQSLEENQIKITEQQIFPKYNTSQVEFKQPENRKNKIKKTRKNRQKLEPLNKDIQINNIKMDEFESMPPKKQDKNKQIQIEESINNEEKIVKIDDKSNENKEKENEVLIDCQEPEKQINSRKRSLSIKSKNKSQKQDEENQSVEIWY